MAGYKKSGSKSSSGAGYKKPGSSRAKKQSRRGFLGTLLKTAALAGAGYAAYHYWPDSNDARNNLPKPPSEEIAKYYLNIIVPAEAIKEGKDVNLATNDRQKIFEAIVRYEDIQLSGEDSFLLYPGEENKGKRGFLQEQIDIHRANNVDENLIGPLAVQALSYHRATQAGVSRPARFELSKFDKDIRDLKYNKIYGSLSTSQAKTIALQYSFNSHRPEEATRNVKRYGTRLDHLTNTPAARKKGLVNYSTYREYTIRNLSESIENGQWTVSTTINSSAPKAP